MLERLEQLQETLSLAYEIRDELGEFIALLRALCLTREHDGWGSDKCSSCYRPGMILHRAFQRESRK